MLSQNGRNNQPRNRLYSLFDQNVWHLKSSLLQIRLKTDWKPDLQSGTDELNSRKPFFSSSAQLSLCFSHGGSLTVAQGFTSPCFQIYEPKFWTRLGIIFARKSQMAVPAVSAFVFLVVCWAVSITRISELKLSVSMLLTHSPQIHLSQIQLW